MILLAQDCLLFRLPDGESVPLRAENISIQVSAEAAAFLDDDAVNEAALAVFFYFRHDLGRVSVTMAEFSETLGSVLRLLLRQQGVAVAELPAHRVTGLDLAQFARESAGSELAFFGRLRAALRSNLEHAPAQVRARGLRPCVKALTGARRWGNRCRSLRDEIVAYLRGCLVAEQRRAEVFLVVE